MEIQCEKCGSLHDGSFGSGRFCKKFCANSRSVSEETKEKQRKANKEFAIKNGLLRSPKFCSICNRRIRHENKSGICFPCKRLTSKKSKTKSKNCIICGGPANHLFCGTICSTEHRRRAKINDWLTNPKSITKISASIRNYILEEQNNVCAICGMKQEWNGQQLKFICDHISGNNKDHSRQNLRMICPNCDSQLPTFKSKNKGNGREYDRKHRKKYYHDNKEKDN